MRKVPTGTACAKTDHTYVRDQADIYIVGTMVGTTGRDGTLSQCHDDLWYMVCRTSRGYDIWFVGQSQSLLRDPGRVLVCLSTIYMVFPCL